MSVRVTGSIAAFAATLPALAKQIAEKVAVDLKAAAMQNIREMDAVDTGNMLNSGEVYTEGETVVVIFNADYSLHVHSGTRFVGARPFLTKAVEDVRGTLPEGINLDVRVGGMTL